MDPYWNKFLIAGHKDGQSFLGYLDLYGTQFTENYAATGYGNMLCLPLIRERWRPDLSEDEARMLLEECMRVLWYRDTKALNKIQVAKITAEGQAISEPYSLETKWDYKLFVKPKAEADTGGSW
jgi:20S proteasome subunit beta 7